MHNEKPYEIKIGNMWMTKFDIFCEDIDIGDISFNWKWEVIIRLKNEFDFTKHFKLQFSSKWWEMDYILQLTDFLTNHIWTFQREKDAWKKNKIGVFYIDSGSDHQEEKNNMDEILLLAVSTFATLICTYSLSLDATNAATISANN
jgi:hypothetical protein